MHRCSSTLFNAATKNIQPISLHQIVLRFPHSPEELPIDCFPLISINASLLSPSIEALRVDIHLWPQKRIFFLHYRSLKELVLMLSMVSHKSKGWSNSKYYNGYSLMAQKVFYWELCSLDLKIQKDGAETFTKYLSDFFFFFSTLIFVSFFSLIIYVFFFLYKEKVK